MGWSQAPSSNMSRALALGTISIKKYLKRLAGEKIKN